MQTHGRRWLPGLIPGLALALVLMAAGPPPAHAQVNLAWAPADTITAPGDTLRLSLMLDQPLDLRTVEFTATYDTALVQSLDGEAGSLFTAGGFDLFTSFPEVEPGRVHGYCVIMGHDDFLTGPGELFTWDISGRAVGTTFLSTVDVKLYTPDAVLVPDVTLDDADLEFQKPSPVHEDLPTAVPALRLVPNPFNPRTLVSFTLEADSHVRLSVFDARGRLVDVLLDQAATAGLLTAVWSGHDKNGNPVPGGTYLFRLETVSGVARSKGLLLK